MEIMLSSCRPTKGNQVRKERDVSLETTKLVTPRNVEHSSVCLLVDSTVDNNKHQPCIDELEVFTSDVTRGNIALARHGTVPTSSGNYSTQGKHQLKHINDGRYGNDFSWISNEDGKGWVQLSR